MYFSNMSAYEDRFDRKIEGYIEEQERFKNEKKGVILSCWNQSEQENYHLWKNYDQSAGYGVFR